MQIVRENWYKTAKIAESLYKDAGMSETTKEWLPAGILSALLAVLMGILTVQTAAKSNHVSEEELKKALNNKELVSKVQMIAKQEQTEELTYSPINKDKPIIKPKTKLKPKQDSQHSGITIEEIIDVILQHEGLKKGQTPFRITNPSQRKRDNYYGFPVNKNPQAPLNRQNFIYLKNPSHVPLAVKKLFESYTNNPSYYGLGNNPTLEEALRKFDQSNVNSKISFLKSQINGLDTNQPLSNFLK